MKKVLTILGCVILLVSVAAVAGASPNTNWNWQFDGAGTASGNGSTDTSGRTDVTVQWDATGGSLSAFAQGVGDAKSSFLTGGFVLSGTFSISDYNNNPYGYGVDDFDAHVLAHVGDSGYIEFSNSRLDSKSSMYGPAGQSSFSYITTDATADMAYGVHSNYAAMTNGQYSRQKVEGYNFLATGNHQIVHQLVTGTDLEVPGPGAMITVQAIGESKVRAYGETAQGTTFNFNRLPVCGDGLAWDDHYATFEGTGTGVFQMLAWANNSLTFGTSDDDPVTFQGTGGASMSLIVNYTNATSVVVPDYGISGN